MALFLLTEAAGAAPITDFAGLLQAGGFTALAAILLGFSLWVYRQQAARCDRLEARNEAREDFWQRRYDERERFWQEREDANDEFVRTTVLPAMTESGQALREATEALRDRAARQRYANDNTR